VDYTEEQVPDHKLTFQPREKPPGWRFVGVYYTSVPDAIYPPDWNAFNALKETDPDLMYLWSKWVYLAPVDDADHYEVVIEGRHALARYRSSPWRKPVNWHLTTLGVDTPIPRPNILELHLDYDMGSSDNDFPGPYEPFDWDAYDRIKSKDNRMSMTAKEQARAVVRPKVEAKQRIKDHNKKELAYMNADFTKWSQGVLDDISEVEVKEQLRKQRLSRTKKRR